MVLDGIEILSAIFYLSNPLPTPLINNTSVSGLETIEFPYKHIINTRFSNSSLKNYS